MFQKETKWLQSLTCYDIIIVQRGKEEKSMTNAEKKHLEEIERVKKAMRETNSSFLYKDYKKYLKRLMKELKQYRDYRNAKMM